MHGGTRTWTALLAATLVICAGSAMAQSLENPSALPADDPAYALGERSVLQVSTPARFASSDAPPSLDLKAELEKLKAEIQKMKDKEAKSKEKAAGKPSIKVGGRIQADWALFGQGDASRNVYGDLQDGCEFRRARIFVSGDAFHVVDYKIQMDFADTDTGSGSTEAIYYRDGGGNLQRVLDADGNPVSAVTSTKTIQSTAFKDVYIGLSELPFIGHARIGHFKEPFGLEQLTSARFITFMERSLSDEGAFVPARRMGIMAYDTYLDERGTWAIGAFRSEQTNGAEPPFRLDDDGGTAVTMRATFLPWYDDSIKDHPGRGLLHTGIAYSYRNIDDGTARFRSRPEAHLSPARVVDTGSIHNVPDEQLLGLELASVYGPLSVQAEYFGCWVPREGIGVAYLNGGYVYASFFLTGENRHYSRSKGAFDRVKPFTNFFRVRTGDGIQNGWGAWEVAYRYSYIDLVDNGVGVNGGVADDHTLGLNWYLNPYTRVMWNYVLSSSTPEYGVTPVTDLSVFQMRAQIDF